MRNMSFYALSYDKGFKKLIEENKKQDGDRDLKVHSIFKRVVNIKDINEKIYSILQASLDNGPFASRIQVDGNFDFQNLKIQVNDKVKIQGESLEIEDKMVIYFKGVKLWSQESLSIEINKTNKEVFYKNLEIYNSFLLDKGSKGGSKYYYLATFMDVKLNYKASLIEKALKDKISNFLKNLDNGAEELRDSLLKIIGFGNGLTPSGDDFLIAFMTAINSFESKKNKDLFKRIRSIFKKEKLSTTDISKNMIEDSLDGYARERIVNFIKQLFKDDNKEFKDSMEELFSIGSSSGVDLSVGIILGCMYSLDTLKNGGKVDEKYHS